MESIAEAALYYMATSIHAAGGKAEIYSAIKSGQSLGAVQKLAHAFLEITDATSLKSQDPLFASGGRHDCLWPKATMFLKSLDV